MIRIAVMLVAAVMTGPLVAAEPPAFPGAQGWAATTPGGRGGKILRVTSLAAEGPGTLAEAIATQGPRIVVFEIAGAIDLDKRTLRVEQPFLTIAGQTAPSPGITLVRGGIDIVTHDVIVRHIRVRPGEAGAAKRGGPDFDAISTIGAHDVVVDHCSLTWATDENLSASGTRFTGSTLAEWRAGTSHRITFSNNLIAEGLAYSTHIKGEHSKGSLIHDNVQQILIVGNLYANNAERNPLFKGGVQGAIVNNLIYNPGQRAVHYNLIAEEWGANAPVPGEMTLIGNVLRAGPSTPQDIALLQFGGSGDLVLHARDNLAVDRLGRPLPMLARYTTARARVIEVDAPPGGAAPGISLIATEDVQDRVVREAGARPWDRDPVDSRIIADVIEGRGAIINSEQDVGGYPRPTPAVAPFRPDEWDMLTVTRRVAERR
ncbi:MAG: pectate lyase [Pseudomonadota bacterium]